eukprot:TRINITY_DN7784_c0_g2_i1.p1 TRINITY_DN7784_c0_g2~~TRINITY_DN7784_c0_g2_i1.p1  ORF type:complete len:233 (+),score=39.65 TRINITY_DN7784_c0_g2_i1:72-770(+)
MAKYLWGNAPFGLWAVGVGCVLAAVITGALLNHIGPGGHIDDFPKAKDLRGCLLVMLGYVLIVFVLLGNQVSLKFEQGSDEELKQQREVAYRGVYNNMEQALPFLIVFWLHALFVNPETTAVLGGAWAISRYLYIICFGWYGRFNSLIELPQSVTYCITWYLTIAVFWKCQMEEDLHSKMAGQYGDCGVFITTMLAASCAAICFRPLAKLSATIIVKGVAYDRGYKPPLASC